MKHIEFADVKNISFGTVILGNLAYIAGSVLPIILAFFSDDGFSASTQSDQDIFFIQASLSSMVYLSIAGGLFGGFVAANKAKSGALANALMVALGIWIFSFFFAVIFDQPLFGSSNRFASFLFDIIACGIGGWIAIESQEKESKSGLKILACLYLYACLMIIIQPSGSAHNFQGSLLFLSLLGLGVIWQVASSFFSNKQSIDQLP